MPKELNSSQQTIVHQLEPEIYTLLLIKDIQYLILIVCR